MNTKSLGMLVVALVCGLGAMLGVNQLLARKTPAVTETIEILVAARDLKVEEVLKPELVRLMAVPRSGAPADAFSAFKDVEDRWLTINLLEGEPILGRKLAPEGTPAGLVSRIPQGMRAFAIDVNEQTGVSGFVLPDHRVDVVMVQPDAARQGGRAEAETILEDVQVLASGQVFSRPEDRSLQSRTVTLAVSPAEVDKLVSAKSRGTLTLSLRGVNDHGRAPRREPEGADGPTRAKLAVTPPPVVVAPPPPPPPPPPPAPEPVPPERLRPRIVAIHRGPRLIQHVQVGAAAADADRSDELAGPDEGPASYAGSLRPASGPGLGPIALTTPAAPSRAGP